jgi:hypothetical protein
MDATRGVPGHLWFVRRGERVSGPFPIGALRQEDVLGRLRDATALSPDGQRWYEPRALRPLLDAGMARYQADEWIRQRAIARARWADQRGGIDRRAGRDPRGQKRRINGDRRSASVAMRAGFERREETSGIRAERKIVWIVLALLGAIAGGAVTYGTSNPVPVNLDVRPHLP